MEELFAALADLINLIYWVIIIMGFVFIIGPLLPRKSNNEDKEDEE